VKASPAAERVDPQEEIAALVGHLHETQQRLLALTGGEIDAVVHPGGQSYLLYEAQEKLRLSDEAQRGLAETQTRILNALPAHIALLDSAGTILSVNESWKRFAPDSADAPHGPGASVGQNYLIICDRASGDGSDGPHLAAAGVRDVLTGATRTFSLEYPYHSPTERRWFRLIVTPVRDDRRAGAVLAHYDVTPRKLAELAMQDSESRFRWLVDSNVQGVAFWTARGALSGGNDAFLQMVGCNREDMSAGRVNWVAITPPEYAERDRDALREIRAKGVCAPFEKEFIRPDGTRVPVLIGAAAFEDNPDEGVLYAIDLTARKKLEQQFLRSQRMEGIGTLAGGMAHNLNNVLAPIIMSIDLLKLQHSDPGDTDLLDALSSSAHRGAAMVRQILLFARGVEGQRMPVQAKHVIQDMEKIANDTFLKHVQVRTILPDDLWSILGDPTQIQQVLLNLCVNARDAMPEGGTLTLAAENVQLDAHYARVNPAASPGPYVVLRIEDTGTGIAPAVIERMFDPFFTTKEIGKGTGLGLSTSLAIVKSHGGFMQVYSEVGKGTTIKVYFPGRTDLAGETVTAVIPDMPRGHGERILVVDDEPSVREITRRTLEAFGYRVVLASDGAEAVAIVARQGADVAAVITDMMMPVMDGPATIQVLLKLRAGLPIIGASGLSANGSVARAASLGVTHFLAKPYTAAELLQTLRQVLPNERPRHAQE
jgi:PAS domain S-box-containing protein